MSNNYNTIAKARDIAKVMIKHPHWTKTAVIKETGVGFTLFQDMLEMDPVSVCERIKKPTVEKLKAFIAKHESICDPPQKPEHEIHRGAKNEFNDIKLPASMKDAIPEPSSSSLASGGDPLARLSELIEEFNKIGYKLDVNISRVYEPITA